MKAAARHCGSRWLVKFDIISFFEAVTEISVYRVFRQTFGYQPLVAFELSRICTRIDHPRKRSRSKRYKNASGGHRRGPYHNRRIGWLPQGAPTSPALANLCAIELDKAIQNIADEFEMTYTRYADDIVLSSGDRSFSRTNATSVIGRVYAEMSKHGFSPNTTKTRITSPGSRKIVLGLLVNGDHPKIPRDFRAQIRQHLHYLGKGQKWIVEHARKKGFASVIGLRNHLRGKIAFVSQIDRELGSKFRRQFDSIEWPI